MYKVAHKYKPKMIIPFVGISDNIGFLLSKDVCEVLTADNVKCKVVDIYEKHICLLEDEIRKVYGIEPWAFLQKWYNAYDYMQSMNFVVLTLEKI